MKNVREICDPAVLSCQYLFSIEEKCCTVPSVSQQGLNSSMRVNGTFSVDFRAQAEGLSFPLEGGSQPKGGNELWASSGS